MRQITIMLPDSFAECMRAVSEQVQGPDYDHPTDQECSAFVAGMVHAWCQAHGYTQQAAEIRQLNTGPVH